MDMNAFLIDLSNSNKVDLGRVNFAKQSEPQKVFCAVWVLESELNNGGFDQYLRNSESTIIAYAPVALRTIGASQCAGIVERAIQVVAPIAPTQDGRYETLDALGDDGQDRLAELDTEFFEYPDDLTDLLFKFVRQHPDVFGPVPNS